MVDWNRKFRSEYDVAREVLASAEAFEADWQPMVAQLARLMGRDGFDVGRADALDELRRRATHGGGVERLDEADGLLRAVGQGGDGGLVADDARRRAAALKLLRHVYLEGRAGSRNVWVVALPTEFTDWPSTQFADAANVAGARQLLSGRGEHFDVRERRWLGAATQQGLAWCQRATMVLADARRARAGAPAERAGARTLVFHAVTFDAAAQSRTDSGVRHVRLEVAGDTSRGGRETGVVRLRTLAPAAWASETMVALSSRTCPGQRVSCANRIAPSDEAGPWRRSRPSC